MPCATCMEAMVRDARFLRDMELVDEGAEIYDEEGELAPEPA